MTQESTPNPNVFAFTIQGKRCYADPLKVRRVLLQHTMGKCWGLTREINKCRRVIEESRKKVEDLEADVAVNPMTEGEKAVLEEQQKATAEGKQSTIPFDRLPRVSQIDGYANYIAVHSNRMVELEGVLAAAALNAFDLTPVDLDSGIGVTEQEALDTLKIFMEYAEGKGERLGG